MIAIYHMDMWRLALRLGVAEHYPIYKSLENENEVARSYYLSGIGSVEARK